MTTGRSRAFLMAGVLIVTSTAHSGAMTEIPRLVAEELAANGRARVVLELTVPVREEGRLAKAQIAQQRARIAAAGDELLLSMPEGRARALHRYMTVPLLAVEVDEVGAAALASSRLVGKMRADFHAHPALSSTVRIVGADRLHAQGVDGQGWRVAIVDSGVEGSHPFLVQPVAEACFASQGRCPNGGTRQEGLGAGSPCTGHDGCFHGTHVAGIALGASNSLVGVAPAAELVAVNVFSVRTGSACGDAPSPCLGASVVDILAGLDWLVARADSLRLASVNLSLGGPYFSTTEACDAEDPGAKSLFEQLRSKGVLPVVSSGNGGRSDAVAWPGCLSNALSVGASDKTDRVATSFPFPASGGSDSAKLLKLLAPGVDVFASTLNGGFGAATGTSMAAPHVAGALALLREVAPTSSAATLEAVLRGTGPFLLDPRNGFNRPRLAAFDAALMLQGARADCVEDRETLCLMNGRFSAQLYWSNQYSGVWGTGKALPLTDATGMFYFTDPKNVELLVKVLDFGSTVKVFFGQLTNLEFQLILTDTETGEVRLYSNSRGECGGVDDNGFPGFGSASIPLPKASSAASCRPSANRLCLLNNRIAL